MDNRPLGVFVVVGQIDSVFAVLLHAHTPSRIHSRQRVIVEHESAHIPRRELEKILFDPIIKPGGELGGVDLNPVNRILIRLAHKTQHPPAPFGTQGPFVFLPHHQPRQRQPRGVPDLDELADSGHAWLELLRIGLDHAVGLMIGRRRAHHIEHLQIDQLRGGGGELVFGVGGVVLMRREHPHSPRLHHLEGVERCQVLVVLHHFQAGCLRRIGEFGEQHPLLLRLDRAADEPRLEIQAQQKHPGAAEQEHSGANQRRRDSPRLRRQIRLDLGAQLRDRPGCQRVTPARATAPTLIPCCTALLIPGHGPHSFWTALPEASQTPGRCPTPYRSLDFDTPSRSSARRRK